MLDRGGRRILMGALLFGIISPGFNSRGHWWVVSEICGEMADQEDGDSDGVKSKSFADLESSSNDGHDFSATGDDNTTDEDESDNRRNESLVSVVSVYSYFLFLFAKWINLFLVLICTHDFCVLSMSLFCLLS